MKRLPTALALALATVLALAACGTGGGGGSRSAVNDADVSFAREMVPHHRQAVEMAKMAATNASSAEVKTLAGRIAAEQEPEIATMKGWLADWDESEGSTSDHGAMTGMMSSGEMAELDQARGAAFDAMFLRMMIAHHEGAIEMARTEQADGSNPDATALAKRIARAQTSEIKQMRSILGS